MNYDQKRVVTLPNCLTALRLVLIPCFFYCYCFKNALLQAAGVLLLSGLTDVADGYLARRFHQVSDLGKVLDPVADKLTQGVVLLCLATRFPQLMALAVVLSAKELMGACFGLAVMHHTGKVESARWHGKASACILYGILMIHLLFPQIPGQLTGWLILLGSSAALLSFVLYGVENGKLYRRVME